MFTAFMDEGKVDIEKQEPMSTAIKSTEKSTGWTTMVAKVVFAYRM